VSVPSHRRVDMKSVKVEVYGVETATNRPSPSGVVGIARAEPDDTCAETRFRLSEKRTSPFESAGVSAQSAGRRLC
jgi:hypothetical protein